MRAAAPLLVLAFLLGCRAEPTKVKKPMPRADLEKLVMGEPLDKVKADLGAPDQAAAWPGGGGWDYRGLTVDPESGRPDLVACLKHDGGRVTAVEYIPPTAAPPASGGRAP